MKKIFVAVLFLFVFPICVLARDFDVTSHHIVLFNMLDDTLLYEELADEKVSIASLTKIMTTVVALENVKDLEEIITIKEEDFNGTVGYSEAGFKIGDKVTVMDLLYGVMLPSGADAVNAIVRKVSGNQENFVNLMNDLAKKIALKNTHFQNPIGKDHEDNYSTANDVARLLKYALQNDVFKKIFTTKYYKVPSNGLELRSTLSHYSMLDTSIIMGSKSGFTKGAGRCLASISEINGVDYLLVVIKSLVDKNYNAVKDTLTIYDYYSKNYSYKTLLSPSKVIASLPVKWGKRKNYEVKLDKSITKYLKNGTAENLSISFDGVDEITAKMSEGEKLGVVSVYHEEELLYQTDVFLDTTLDFYHPVLYLFLVGIVFFLVLVRRLKKKKKAHKK